MITTYAIKQQQLKNGYYQTGTGDTTVLIIGSCRVAPYVNYFRRLNTDNRFKICHIDPFNWNWDEQDNRVDYEKVIESLETDPRILNLLAETKWYIHEYYDQFGMFNTSKDKPKNIHQFGLNPELDICIPNFNDLFILFQDIYTFDKRIQELVQMDYKQIGMISEDTKRNMKEIGEANIDKFLKICSLSDFGEMAQVWHAYSNKLRFFWTYNHITMHFSRTIFELMNIKFLRLELEQSFWDAIEKEDLFAEPHTALTQYDIEAYGFNWKEDVKEFKL